MSAELTGPLPHTHIKKTQDVRQFAVCLSMQYCFEKGKVQVLKCAFCGLVAETRTEPLPGTAAFRFSLFF